MKKTTVYMLLISLLLPVFSGCSTTGKKLVVVDPSVWELLEVTRKNNAQLAREVLKRYDWHYERLVNNVDALVAHYQQNGKPDATVVETLNTLKEEREQFIASLQLCVENEKNLVEIRDALGYESGADNDKLIMGSLAAIGVALGMALAAA